MTTKKLVYTAFFIALGILVPQVFHSVGGPGIGQIFLPMHYPVIIGGMLLGPLSGGIIGVASVMIGMILGMPPFTIGIFMIFELMTYGIISGLVYYQWKWNLYVSLICVMGIGRVVSMVTIYIGLQLFEVKLPPLFGQIGMFSVAIPGMVVQLVLIPILMMSLTNIIKKQRSI